MAKYNCLTFGSYANLLKKDIKAAMRGKERIEVYTKNNEYEKEIDCPKDECEKIILGSVDEIVHHALKAMAACRVLEKLAKENGVEYTQETLARYIVLAEEEELKYNDYEFEPLEEN